MNRERAKRHSRWRLPSGVYNPIVSPDGRRWRDYERAAETAPPFPARGDGRPAMANGVTGGVLGRLVNGTGPGHGGSPNGAAGGLANGLMNGTAGHLAMDLLGGADRAPAEHHRPGPAVPDRPEAGGGEATGDAREPAPADRPIPEVPEPRTAADDADPSPAVELPAPARIGDDAGVAAEDDRAPEPEGTGETAEETRDTEPVETVARGDAERIVTAEEEAELDWLDRPNRPPRLEETRPYGRPGGLAEPTPESQANLEQAVNGRFPDPRGTWIRLINAEGPTEDPFRSTNAVDCALAVISTWHGEPVVAARRLPEYDPSGRPLLTGETGGVARAEAWLGHRFEYVGHGCRAYTAIAERLRAAGHGGSAVLITRWPGGGSHAWNAVNCRGEVLWIDAQRGHMAVEPPYEDVTAVFAVIMDRHGRRM